MKSLFYPEHSYWQMAAAQEIIDLGGGNDDLKDHAEAQLESAVALQHRLLSNGVAYLADEVGMGKTYVALATIALFRFMQPSFRVLYITPSENVRQKWAERELPAFVRHNLRHSDFRLRGPGHQSVSRTASFNKIDDFAVSCAGHDTPGDTFLSITTLSFPLTDDANSSRVRLIDLMDKCGKKMHMGGPMTKERAKSMAAELLHSVMPVYDLIVIDEAHLLKGGESASHRVKFLAKILGTSSEQNSRGEKPVKKFRGVLLLSATPFDRDLSQLINQLQVVNPFRNVVSNTHIIFNEIKGLVPKRGAPTDWEKIQQGLRPLMIRRIQRLKVGDIILTRNQYRREHRDGSAIVLKNRIEPDVIKQRLFTALVQKKLVEHLDGHKGGAFPLAMFASWEAYSMPVTSKPDISLGLEADDEPTGGENSLDMAHEEKSRETAADLEVMKSLSDSHRHFFKSELPHPKLESEACRLAKKAFIDGDKQLVFVRRIKSVDDLKIRIEEQYDRWLARYLEEAALDPGKSGHILANQWLEALDRARQGKRPVASLQSMETEGDDDGLDLQKIPPSLENLFVWLFRGKQDADAFKLLGQLPLPLRLREDLINKTTWTSLMGELNWRGWLIEAAGLQDNISLEELACRASQLSGGNTRLDQYRKVQTAWLLLTAAQVNDVSVSQALQAIAVYQQQAFSQLGDSDGELKDKIVEELLSAATLPLSLYRAELEKELIPEWQRVWALLLSATDSAVAGAALRQLDLFREIQFSLVRLDHPFIDLYIACCHSKLPDSRLAVDALLEGFVDRLVSQVPSQFSSRRILGQLAEGWRQVVKVNFAKLLNEDGDVIERASWRRNIQNTLSPFSPVEWANGTNVASRAAIARRFRMPGYPMALVSTSVFQEGEDLHLFCNQVTHYGITGSPIGIEQKNGRVDRIGSLTQRNLANGESLDKAAIQISFPHLTESLEWFQIRELCWRLNRYLESMHEFATVQENAPTLKGVFADRRAIPPQITSLMRSPFDPQLQSHADEITPSLVEQTRKLSQERYEHACQILASTASQMGLKASGQQTDIFRSVDNLFTLNVHPGALVGDWIVQGERRLLERELNGRRSIDSWVIGLSKGKYRRLIRRKDENDADCWYFRASCLARGKELLQPEEMLDVAFRLDMRRGKGVRIGSKKHTIDLLKHSALALDELNVTWQRNTGTPTEDHILLWSLGENSHKVKVQLMERKWLVISIRIKSIGGWDDARIAHEILRINKNMDGVTCSARYRFLHVSMVQPLVYLQPEEFTCMVQTLLRIARTEI
jgi:hypothetical protein